MFYMIMCFGQENKLSIRNKAHIIYKTLCFLACFCHHFVTLSSSRRLTAFESLKLETSNR